MNNGKFVLAFLIVFSTLKITSAQVSPNYRKLELSNKITSQTSSREIEERYNNSAQSTGKEKSPYLGALFSGLIPGTGELYAQRYLKGAIFLAIEAGLWIGYSHYQTKGNNQTDQFERYADQNWDVYKYAGWLKTNSFAGSDAINLSANKELLRTQINYCEQQSGFSHQLPAYGEQQYYELIGKYQTFISGWADADLGVVNRNNFGTYKTQMFTDYSYSRQQANTYYDDATTTLILVVVNHLLSSADGAWSVSMFNKGLKVRTGVQMENKYTYAGERKLMPVANLNISF